MIYLFVFCDTQSRSCRGYQYPLEMGHGLPQCRSSQMLRTCKLVYKEARTILYGSCLFGLKPDSDEMAKFLDPVGPVNACTIRNLSVEIVGTLWTFLFSGFIQRKRAPHEYHEHQPTFRGHRAF
jgi:hypothetical protein